MQEPMTIDRLAEARGAPVFASDGEEIGQVEEIFYDEQTKQPEWLGIGTGFFGTKRALIPMEGAELRPDGFYVPYTKDQVKDSPDIDKDEISQETEQELYAHYGLEYSERRSDTGLPEGGPRGRKTGKKGEKSVTRAEEELEVGKREVDAGRVRLRKWVETEPVEVDVELKRETARVTREPIDQPVSEGEIGEEQIDVQLRGEKAVAQKRTVAKERVGIEKDVETERETVRDEVRKERVEVEDDQKGKRKR
jgi:uncharacterized protein (TIGR02271 family)